MTELTPQQEDPVVHGLLENLESFSPRPGFADRVLAQVSVEPVWLLKVREIRSTLFDRQTRWVWATGAAASAVFSLFVYTTIALTNWSSVQTAWATVLSTIATTPLLSPVDTLISVEGALPAAIAASVLMMFGCAFGLRRTVRDFQAERVPISVNS